VSLAADLAGLVSVNDGDSALDQHAADLSYHPGARPDAVVYPESTGTSSRCGAGSASI
jgi:hypothetical protein